MPKAASFILTLLLALASLPALAQDDLPRVLIIGDSIAGMYSSQTSQALKGKARVEAAYRPHDMLVNSNSVLKHLDQFLGRIDRNGKPVAEDKWPAWDLIHLNVGLGDLVHCVPDLETIRLMPHSVGGKIATDPEQYEENLNALVRQLKAKAPGATIVWASTTPIRFSRNEVFKLGTEIEYNQIAERVMKKHGVPINDLYSYAKSIMNMGKPAGHGADPFNFDKKPIHPPVVDAIRKALGLPAPPEDDAVADVGA